MFEHLPRAHVDWSALGAALYNWAFLSITLSTFIIWLFRSQIGKQCRRFIDALFSAKSAARQIGKLTKKLDEANLKVDEWRERFDEVEKRHDALDAEFKRLGEDIIAFRKRMTTADELNHMLREDRDALIDFTRLLIGQLVTFGHQPDYKIPSLKSIIAVPGPPLVVPGAPLEAKKL